MPSDVRAAALSCLRDGRVTVRLARSARVIAHVMSSRPEVEQPYIVYRWQGSDGGLRWACTCRAQPGCAHIAAVALVTYPAESAARKP